MAIPHFKLFGYGFRLIVNAILNIEYNLFYYTRQTGFCKEV